MTSRIVNDLEPDERCDKKRIKTGRRWVVGVVVETVLVESEGK